MNLSSDMQTAFSEHIREKEVKLDTDLTVQVLTRSYPHHTPLLPLLTPHSHHRCSPPASGRRTSRTTSTCRRSSSRASRPSAPSTTVTIGMRLSDPRRTAPAHRPRRLLLTTPLLPPLCRPHLPPPAALGALARQRDGARPVHAGRQDEEARPDGVDVPGVPPPRLQRPGRLHLLRHPAAPQPPRRGAQAVSRARRRRLSLRCRRRLHRLNRRPRLARRSPPSSPSARPPGT